MKQLTKDYFPKYTSISYNSIPEKQTPNQKVGKISKHTFLQRRYTDGLQHRKRCSTLLIIREKQIKTTMRYHLILARMIIIRKSTNKKCWRGYGRKGTLLH